AAMLAQAQNTDEDAIPPGGFIPPWAGYGRFSTVMGRRTKAEFRDEFYKRNAYVRSFFIARDHLRAYQECHVAHQRRCFARIVTYKQDQTVATGSIAHSLSKNQLEEANRGPTGEIPSRSDDGYSTDYDSEGDEGMERILASMPSQPPRPVMPPTTDDGAGEDEFQPPDPFPSEKGTFPSPPAFGAEQACEWQQPVHELSSSDDEPLVLDPLPPGRMPLFDPETGTIKVPPGRGWPVELVLPGVSPRLLDTFHGERLQAVRNRLHESKMQPREEAPDSDDEPPGLEPSFSQEEEAVMPPSGVSRQLSRIDLVLPGTGPPLLTFSLDQL
ncbi:MAG: hypothetical protein GY835_19720, partial [bacterium]|nr:hypothetical protein [bacterium]